MWLQIMKPTHFEMHTVYHITWIILAMGSANERRRHIVTHLLIGRAFCQNDPCIIHVCGFAVFVKWYDKCIVDPCHLSTHIHRSYFIGTAAIVRLWDNIRECFINTEIISFMENLRVLSMPVLPKIDGLSSENNTLFIPVISCVTARKDFMVGGVCGGINGYALYTII